MGATELLATLNKVQMTAEQVVAVAAGRISICKGHNSS